MKPIRVMPTRVWRTYFGGREIDKLLDVSEPKDGECPELWVASTVEARNPVYTENEGLSQTAGGEYLRELIAQQPAVYLGSQHVAKFGSDMGILVKILDAKNRLTIQVHPTRETAMKLFHSKFGKTECWYIMGVRDDCEEPPYILLGFKPGVTREMWEDMFARQDIEGMRNALHKIQVKPGEVYFISGGMPHAIGAGCFITELQEPTDYTIRVERKTPEGLTIDDKLVHQGIGFEKMFDCFSYETYSMEQLLNQYRAVPREVASGPGYVVQSLIGPEQTELFYMAKILVEKDYTFLQDGHFSIVAVLGGSGEFVYADGTEPVKKGDLFFIPASSADFKVKADKPLELICHGAGTKTAF